VTGNVIFREHLEFMAGQNALSHASTTQAGDVSIYMSVRFLSSKVVAIKTLSETVTHSNFLSHTASRRNIQ
jgi:hypothetical protein